MQRTEQQEKMKEYRIVEISSKKFVIQIKDVEIKKKGFLWWAKEQQEVYWRRIDNNGYPIIHTIVFSNLHNIMEEFTTLNDAKEKIKELQHEIKYHYIK